MNEIYHSMLVDSKYVEAFHYSYLPTKNAGREALIPFLFPWPPS
jgi:hypothetical protein